MKPNLAFVLLIVFSFVYVESNAQDCGCDITFDPADKSNVFLNGESTTVNPGDVLCFKSGIYTYIRIINIHGTKENPIILKNCGGKAEVDLNGQNNHGFILEGSTHVRVTGSGDENIQYGFEIYRSPLDIAKTGLVIANKISDIEVDHFEIHDVELGMHLINVPDCDETSWRGNWVQENTSVHDMWVHDVGNEGFYIGSSKYNTGHTKTCDGESIDILPPFAKGIKVFNNIIEDSGWDGMQVSMAIEDCYIYNNVIRNFGLDNKPSQQAGIVVGGGSVGDVYNNFIDTGLGDGIDVFGVGNVRIFNNIVANCGEQGIFIGNRELLEPDYTYAIINNTIVNSGQDAIRYNNEFAVGAEIRNNLIVEYGSKSLNLLKEGEGGVNYSSNVELATLAEALFTNAGTGDYSITSGSPAVDAGEDISSLNLFFTDYYGKSRPGDATIDAGASEYSASANLAPVLKENISPKTVKESDVFDFTLEADLFTDPEDGALTITATLANGDPLPAWLNFNGTTFSGTPAISDIELIQIKITAEDPDGGTNSVLFYLDVTSQNDPPVIGDGLVNQTAIATTAFSYQFSSTAFEDPNGDVLTYEVELDNGDPLPDWLSFNASTRTFSGTPSKGDANVITIEVTASDGEVTVTDDFVLSVNFNFDETDCGCDIVFDASVERSPILNGNTTTVNPGDRICVKAGYYHFIKIENVHGTVDQPIEVINCGGLVRVDANVSSDHGFIITKSTHLKVTGTGDPDFERGFEIFGNPISQTKTGLVISYLVSDIHAEYFHIHDVELGLHFINVPSCDEASWQGNWTMENCEVNNFYVHDVKNEGFYIGSSKYGSGHDFDCSGTPTNAQPPLIRHIKVHDNKFLNTGWDAMQVSLAIEDCEIYGNYIENYGLQLNPSQQAGIVVGGGSTGLVYNNYVNNGGGDGIDVFGVGNVRLFNNIIANAGEQGIFIGNRDLLQADYNYYIMNNTIVNSGIDAIRYNNAPAVNNIVKNNLLVNAGGVFISYVQNNEEAVDASNNLTIANTVDAGFINDVIGNFAIIETSTAVDAGTDLSSLGLFTADYRGIERPVGSGWDVGAYEYTTNLPPVLENNIQDQSVEIEGEFLFIFNLTTFSDPDGDPLTYTATLSNDNDLPTWLNFDANNREFSGTPGDEDFGTITIKVTADDGFGGSASTEFDITVSGNRTPVVNNDLVDQSIIADEAFSYQFDAGTFSDPDGDALTYSAELDGGATLPTWLSFDGASRTFTGTPPVESIGETLTVVVSADDSNGGIVSAQFVLSINPEALGTPKLNSSDQILIFPNPVENEWLQFKVKDLTKVHNKGYIFNLQGELIKSVTIDSTIINVDLTETVPGVYFLLINRDSKFIGTTFLKK
ncbi:MAG: putative Ig domain-containing protein [Cyclobacteriaceae bacterium]